MHLSPIHGDRRKEGFTDIPEGTHCELFCPVSKKLLPRMGDVEDGSGAAYYALYLTPKLSAGTAVMISDVWGHYHSRIIDDFELISIGVKVKIRGNTRDLMIVAFQQRKRPLR